MGMLAVGFRIMPPWIGRFMAPVVAAQVTLTAGLCGAHSPEGMLGREVLLPIIPVLLFPKFPWPPSIPWVPIIPG